LVTAQVNFLKQDERTLIRSAVTFSVITRTLALFMTRRLLQSENHPFLSRTGTKLRAKYKWKALQTFSTMDHRPNLAKAAIIKQLNTQESRLKLLKTLSTKAPSSSRRSELLTWQSRRVRIVVCCPRWVDTSSLTMTLCSIARTPPSSWVKLADELGKELKKKSASACLTKVLFRKNRPMRPQNLGRSLVPCLKSSKSKAQLERKRGLDKLGSDLTWVTTKAASR